MKDVLTARKILIAAAVILLAVFALAYASRPKFPPGPGAPILRPTGSVAPEEWE